MQRWLQRSGLCLHEAVCIWSAFLWDPHEINTSAIKWADKKSASTGQWLLGYLVANGKVCLFQTDLTQTSSPLPPPTPGMLRPYAESSATSQQTSISNVIPFYQFYFVFMPREARICGICPKKRLTHAHTGAVGEENTEIKDKEIQRFAAWGKKYARNAYTSWLKLAHWTTKPSNYNTGDWERTFCWGGIVFLYSVMTKTNQAQSFFWTSTFPILSHS